MKRTHIVFGIILLTTMITAISTASYAGGKYSRPKTYTVTAGGEKTESMSDCMSFCSSFVGGSARKSKAMFKKQFGEPISVVREVSTYDYDSYTKIILDCSRGCYARCMQ